MATQKHKIEPVDIGILTRWGARIPDGRDGETWIGTMQGDRRVYVKLVRESWKSAADLIAAQLGRAIGLNIPRPHILLCNTSDLPSDSAFAKQGSILAFACEQVSKNAISFEQCFRTDHERIQALRKSKHYETISAFDELTSNTDRNFGNVVFCPEDGRVAFIDHGRALQIGWIALWGGIEPGLQEANVLIDRFLGSLDDVTKDRLRVAAAQLQYDVGALDLERIASQEQLVRLDRSTDRAQIIRLIQERATLTVELICKRIGWPELTKTTH